MRWTLSMTIKEYKAIWLWSVLCTHSVLKLKDQDQTQDEVDLDLSIWEDQTQDEVEV